MSFGLLSRFYSNMKDAASRKEIACTYGLFPDTMESLLKHGSYVRNLCAHHARLWNRSFTITLAQPRTRPVQILSSLHTGDVRKIYNTLVLLGHMTDVIAPDCKWSQRIFRLIDLCTFPVAGHMGFPSGWRNLPFWTNVARQLAQAA